MKNRMTAAVLAVMIAGSMFSACASTENDNTAEKASAKTTEASSVETEAADAENNTEDTSAETDGPEENAAESESDAAEEVFDESYRRTLFLYTDNYCSGKDDIDDGTYTVDIANSDEDSFEGKLAEYLKISGCGLPKDGTLVVYIGRSEDGSTSDTKQIEYTDTEGNSFSLTKEENNANIEKKLKEQEEKSNAEYTADEAAKQAYSYVCGKYEEILMREGADQENGTYTIDLSADEQTNDFADKVAKKIKVDPKMPKSGKIEFVVSEKDSKKCIETLKLTNGSGETAVYPENN